MKFRVMLLPLLFACSYESRAQTKKGMDSVQLRDVVVTGQYTPQSLKNSVYQVRTIQADYIKMRGATNILGVLDNQLGIRFSNDNTLGETDVELMGMSGAEVKILLDGVPLADRGSTRQSLAQIDVHSIERIEIVEGPMSVVYGTDALAGVINIITKKYNGNKQLSVNAGVQEETVGKEYAAFDGKGQHNASLGVSWGDHGYFASAGITRNNFGGWSDTLTGRAKAWLPKDQLMTNATVGIDRKNIKAWYRLDYLDEDLAAKGDINYDNGKATDAHYLTKRYTHQAQAIWQVNDDLSVNGALSYQAYNRHTRTTIKNFTDGSETLSAAAGSQDLTTYNAVFFRSTAQYSVRHHLSLQPGVEYSRDVSSGQRIEGRPNISNYSIFASAELKPTAGINIRPGVRFSKNSIYDAPPVIPSLNIKVALTKSLDLRLSYARGFRAPALRELYFNFFDASHSIKGNTNLKAEYSNSFTGSLSWQAIQSGPVKVNVTATGFYNDFDNMIDYAYVANSDTMTYVNISKFKTTGGTLMGKVNWKNLELGVGGSYIGRYNKFSADDLYKAADPTPTFVWTPELNGNITYTMRKAGTTLNLSYKYNGVRPAYESATAADGTTYLHEVKSGAYNMADFTVMKTVTKLVNINAGVRNIFNVTNIRNSTANSGVAHSEGTQLPMWYGRSYFLGVNFSWSRK
ncbi:TonB-dependent receptor plug domain-containing protein [Chitinophaga sancti]|uniref:Outer membrane receptor for ferrienterochelin and colicins n=1 Tax=Chitinophaga sancti TaxID=1004 RepID=A0A1K1PHN8_9BACT|nr:TonB-dependent receptor [Chitinophaga sancti]WQD65927.1 TonB-dependent receptor [Chitinophaga sancti]WQG88451.1 TonB-dependent receptor [Chitinophaga sancti]SFW47127.1 outer membrane receptor for ferrienterochelin and colicins [Chitinophaga sancti]